MSDFEDDYMSDKLVPLSENDVRPGLVYNRAVKRQYDLEKKKEIAFKRPKTNKELEEEFRERGLNTAISSDNKGFKMLEKMGFKHGKGLGKAESGVTEPIKVELKLGKSGIGVETHIKEKVQIKKQLKDDILRKKVNLFQFHNKLKQAQRYLEKDFSTAQKICEDLDCRKNVAEPIKDFFWTIDTIRRKRNISEELEDDFNEEFENYVSEENLTEIINYLRTEHLYCMFCAFVATDDEDLRTSCPGPYRNNHEDS